MALALQQGTGCAGRTAKRDPWEFRWRARRPTSRGSITPALRRRRAPAGGSRTPTGRDLRLDQRRHLRQHDLRGRGLRDQPLLGLGIGLHPNTSSAQWITAPGATTLDRWLPNTGGDFLPGNGNTGSNEGIYIYTLAFTITGTGSAGTVTKPDPDHDDPGGRRPVFGLREPDGQRHLGPDRHGRRHGHQRLEQHDQITLQNYGTGSARTTRASRSAPTTSWSSSTTRTARPGAARARRSTRAGSWSTRPPPPTINGAPVPEVATWLPLLGGMGCYGLVVLRRRKARLHRSRLRRPGRRQRPCLGPLRSEKVGCP
jgi:hypothetical protein